MKNEIKTAGEILRQTAEELLKSKSSKSTTQLSKIETQKLIHELEVHQIELELQNEELLLASIESKKAAEKFSDLYDFAPSGYFTLSKNGEIIELNLCGAQMLGKERVYLINRRFGFFVSDDTKPIFNLFLDQAFKSRVKESCEISIVIDRQILIYVHLSGIVSENGEHCLVNVIDITESKRTEEALKASEELYRNLIEKMPDGVYKSTHDGKFVSVNPAMVAMLGYDSIEELMAIDIKKELYFGKEDRNRLVAEEEKNGFAVFKMKRKDGSGIWVEDNPWYSTDEKGNILYHEGIIRDVTERKRAELELREKEFQYRSLVNSGKALIWTTGTDKLCNYFNEPWLKFTGRTLDQEMGNGWTEGVHRDDFDRCLETYNTAFDKREEFEMEYRMHHVSGEYRWILDIGTPNYNSNGEFIGYIGHSFDITDRKLAEEALAWEQYLMNALMNNLPDHIYFKDKESRFIKINDAHAQLFGLSVPGEEIGKTDFDFFTEEHARQAYEDEQTIILSGKPLIKEEKETWSDRPDTWASTIKLPLVNLEGNIIGTFGISRDITERKNAEVALTESEEKLSTLFASMTEMVVLNELVFNELGEAINYRIIDCNNAFTVNTGNKKEDAVGKLASDIYQTDTPPNLEIYAKVGITGEPYEFTNYYAPMDKYFMVSVISPKKNQFSTIATDITAIQQIQEEIKDKNKELENYLYVASHDLRSPLVNIQGFSQRFKKQSDAIKNALAESQQKAETKQSLDRITNEDIPKTLNFILSNVSKMDSLINGLLQISRTGRVAMIIRKVDMNHLMKTIIAGYNFQITEFSAKVIIEDLSDCYGDENQLNQLFSNIISNALKYRDSSRKLVIEIASRVQFNKVIYSVKDTGIGIGSRHLEKIWNVFYRVDSASREVGEGIGLSIAKRIIDKHKGKIWAESEEGKGSIFYIELQKNQFEE